MSTQRKWLWAVGAIAAGTALVAFGVPAHYVLIGGLLLFCPAMMFFMGREHDGSKKEQPGAASATPRDSAGKDSKPS